MRALRTFLTAATLTVVVAGCAGYPGNQGDAIDPVLVKGLVLNKLGVPYAGATLELHVVDPRPEATGGSPIRFLRRFTSNFDGTFALHVSPTPELVALAAANGGSLSFRLVAVFPDEPKGASGTFNRGLEAGLWGAFIPDLLLRREPDDD
ncbi:MAG TPA: hypothetical protein VJ850_10005 [Candidatus Limnocylindrales bacterium]|nr:hypothetical protein [Candidatus Limnocylindrales bacterium]